jgi:hypothetical protein
MSHSACYAHIAVGVLVAVACHCCAFEHHNFLESIMVRTSKRALTVATDVSSPPSVKHTKGKPKNARGHPSAKVNSPDGRSKQNSSLTYNGVKCLPIKKSSSPSKTTTPCSKETKRPSLPMQQEECKGRKKSSRRIENGLLCFHLRRRNEKIWQLSADVVEGYGKYYEKKYRRPLPVDEIVKIKIRFLHRIERRCAELGLSVNEEKQWIPDPDLLDKIDLSDSGEESEEHNSDDVNYYSGSSSEDEVEDGQLLQG